MRNETGADVALVQEGGIRSDQVYGPGNITGIDVFSTLPFGNTLVTLEVTGEDLKAALASQIRSDQPEEGVAQQVSGISFEWTDDPNTDEKVQNVAVGGEPLDEDATYTLTVSNFIAEGGDNYPLADQPRVAETDKLLATTVVEYMEALGTVSPDAEGRTEEIGADDGSSENASMIEIPNGIQAATA